MKRPRLFTAKEASALIGISVSAFNSWIRQHGVPGPYVVIGNRRRFTIDQVDAIKQARKERL